MKYQLENCIVIIVLTIPFVEQKLFYDVLFLPVVKYLM